MFSSIRPFLVLFFTSMGRKIAAAARTAVARVATEAIGNPQWSDQQRRERAVAIVKEEIGVQFPGSAFLINFAVEYAVGVLRSAMKR